mmetsp:Transcript_17913/g.53831  ORF Transcript_17913/g.53831 Transcript_17913/m.53831 type:complete len:260 (-) Transcript_17913:268-1047(-)
MRAEHRVVAIAVRGGARQIHRRSGLRCSGVGTMPRRVSLCGALGRCGGLGRGGRRRGGREGGRLGANARLALLARPLPTANTAHCSGRRRDDRARGSHRRSDRRREQAAPRGGCTGGRRRRARRDDGRLSTAARARREGEQGGRWIDGCTDHVGDAAAMHVERGETRSTRLIEIDEGAAATVFSKTLATDEDAVGSTLTDDAKARCFRSEHLFVGGDLRRLRALGRLISSSAPGPKLLHRNQREHIPGQTKCRLQMQQS